MSDFMSFFLYYTKLYGAHFKIFIIIIIVFLFLIQACKVWTLGNIQHIFSILYHNHTKVHEIQMCLFQKSCLEKFEAL